MRISKRRFMAIRDRLETYAYLFSDDDRSARWQSRVFWGSSVVIRWEFVRKPTTRPRFAGLAQG